ncbi:MAG: CaiB/BaiF CoA-transferase family protein [Pseudomonadota bacterium]
MAGPLEGIRILDATWALSGPFGIMTLCDLGAETIKVERPNGGDITRQNGPIVQGTSLYFQSVNRGKKSIVLDLKTDEGKALFLDLAKNVDVVAENFVPGTMDKLGLGYEVLKEHNPRVVYATTSGFGQTGPYRGKPAVDVIVQGMGGVMSITGEENGPPVRPGISIGDIAAGLFLAIGILSALAEREKSGLGQMVDVSMLDCQVAILENAFVRYLNTGEVPQRLGTRHPSVTPFQAFQTKDGHIVISVGGGIEQWAIFTKTIGRPELLSDERFMNRTTRTTHHKVLEPILAEALKAKTTKDWIAEFESIGVPCGPLNTIPEAAVDPQILDREMFVELGNRMLGKVKVCNTPIKLSRTQAKLESSAPELGEHTREILSGILGLDEDKMRSLEASGVTAPSAPTP